jgi:peptidoglycan biosynthesis protein MviN/MurJ (putative lipid II flippase)
MFIGVSAMISTILLFRAYFAKGDAAGAALIGISGAVLYYSLSGMLSKRYGLQGIVVAYAVSWWIQLIWALLRLWRNNLSELMSSNNIRFLGQLIFALGVCGPLVWVGDVVFIRPAIDSSIVALALRLLIVGAIATVLFVITTARGLKMAEVTSVLDILPLAKWKRRLCGRCV